MFEFELMDFARIDRQQFDRTVKSPFRTIEWLEFLRDWRHISPVVVRISSHMEGTTIGWFVGTEKRVLNLRFLGSPLPGCMSRHMGFEIIHDVDISALVDEFLEYSTKVLKYVFVTVTDLKISEEITNNCRSKTILGEPYTSYYLDLTQNQDTLFKNVNDEYRRTIRKFYKDGGTIEEDYSADYVERYNEQLKEVYARDGAQSPNSINKITKLFEHFKNAGMILSVKAMSPEHGNIASMGFLGFGELCAIAYSASHRDYLRSHANQALMWYCILFWKNRGMKVLDMAGPEEYKKKYGIVPKSTPTIVYTKYPLILKLMSFGFHVYYRSFRIVGRILRRK